MNLLIVGDQQIDRDKIVYARFYPANLSSPQLMLLVAGREETLDIYGPAAVELWEAIRSAATPKAGPRAVDFEPDEFGYVLRAVAEWEAVGYPAPSTSAVIARICRSWLATRLSDPESGDESCHT